jgi:hypothetical protein
MSSSLLTEDVILTETSHLDDDAQLPVAECVIGEEEEETGFQQLFVTQMERDSQKLTEFDIPDRLDIAYIQIRYENTIEDPDYYNFVKDHRSLLFRLLYAVKWMYLYQLQRVVLYGKDPYEKYRTNLRINLYDFDLIASTKYAVFINQFSKDLTPKFIPQWTPKKLKPYILWSKCVLLTKENGEVQLEVEVKYMTKCDIIMAHLFPCCLMDFLYRHYCVPT